MTTAGNLSEGGLPEGDYPKNPESPFTATSRARALSAQLSLRKNV